MSKIIEELNAQQIKDIKIPDFAPGDTVVVRIKVVEGNRERLQAFEGVVIAKRNRGINSSFTVRKISYGEGVERVFQTYSPAIDSIEVKRRGDVRQAKLYYLRELRGKKARIKEKLGSNVASMLSTGEKTEKAQEAAIEQSATETASTQEENQETTTVEASEDAAETKKTSEATNESDVAEKATAEDKSTAEEK